MKPIVIGVGVFLTNMPVANRRPGAHARKGFYRPTKVFDYEGPIRPEFENVGASRCYEKGVYCWVTFIILELSDNAYNC